MSVLHSRLPRATGALALVAAALLAGPEPADAQYFGRNKVQYRTFDFRVIQTEHFDVYYYPEEEEAARQGARMAERWYARLSRVLDHEFEQRQPFIFYASHPHFQQTNTSFSTISEGTGGFTEVFKQRVVMPFTYSLEETDHIVGHELVHAFQYDISGLGRAGGGLEQAARRFQVPLWFVEGMAEYLSVGPVDPHTAMWVRDAALEGELPTIERMTYDPRIFPYRWGQALWAYVGGRWGDAAVGQILKLTGQGIPYPEAFQRILNISLEELTEDWHSTIRRAYLPLLADRPVAREIARPLITDTREGGRLNIAPSVSPDGKWVAFISELNFIDAELYLADAETGEVVRRLQRGAVMDPHFGSLRYINSAGTWSPDGRQFAFSALRDGRDVLVILDVERADPVREMEVEAVDEIMSPSWSPDGRSIVFTGLSGGLPDLYRVDLQSGRAEQLTDDPYTELHPSFSPDGRTVAFTTDRGPETDLSRLVYGPYRLATMELATRRIHLVGGMAGAKNINPVWSQDGSALFFISNRGGISNIYRVELATDRVARVTNLFGGVSGITDISPVITSAARADRLLFTAFEDNGYNIYSLSSPQELQGTPLPRQPATDGFTEDEAAEVAIAAEGTDGSAEESDDWPPLPAVLPPAPRPTELAFNRVLGYLDDASTGLPSPQVAAAWPVVDYRPRLGLDYLGQPQVGVSTGGAFGGGGFYGGIAGIFSDVLGRHTLFGAIQAQGQVEEIGGALQYVNSRDRWNYGGMVQRVPYVYGFYSYGADTIGSTPVATQDIVRARFFDTSLQGFASYPFSAVHRLEVSAGLRRIANDYQMYRVPFDPATGQMVANPYVEEIDGISFNMAQATAALVYDNALFGYTSPFAGQRYRLQVTPVVGQLQFIQALADYRRYLWLRPFTLAVRGLHNGKYGRDAEQDGEGRQIFQDMYLGYPWYVRGYYDTYGACRESGGASRDCDVLNQLFGSRVAVATAELRFPLLQALIGGAIPIPPVEGIVFTDAGVAWSRDANPVLQRGPSRGADGRPLAGERGFVTSAGVGARINLFGYMVLEVDYVNGFERDRGWHWQFNFQPGF